MTTETNIARGLGRKTKEEMGTGESNESPEIPDKGPLRLKIVLEHRLQMHCQASLWTTELIHWQIHLHNILWC